MQRLMNGKIPGNGNSKNYEFSDISYSNSFSLILSSSYLQFFHSYSDVFLPIHSGCRVFIVASNHTQWHTNTHSVGPLRTSDQPDAETSTWQDKTIKTDIHDPGGIRNPNPSKREAEDPRFKPRDHWGQIARQFCVKTWTKALPDASVNGCR